MAAVSILQNMNIRCAIFGSMGCRMFGNPRPPNDVDVLLLPPPGNESTQEDFKTAIVARDPVHFFLKNAKDPKATYKVLYYRLDNTSKKETSKVDILLPGVMHLPALSMEKIVWQRRGENVLPVVPFAVLLLQKLQGWDDHRTATENRYIKKAPVDVTDLTNMLQMRHVYPLVVSRPWSDRTLFSEEFEQRSRERVIDFCAQYPQHKEIWQRLGFETEEEDALYTGILRLAI
ncbi:hypothetical protein BDZ94DRAFT_1269618 [Collybia nuda]|uniref:Uncharacterized protein n=1 Tax=Collybia nuda TaxID=64659 RepID=A0A9P5Y068_9AGAR|nr:hypothetical protein BDZ94DRAFT_1269618 [Collybia nuda]